MGNLLEINDKYYKFAILKRNTLSFAKLINNLNEIIL